MTYNIATLLTFTVLFIEKQELRFAIPVLMLFNKCDNSLDQEMFKCFIFSKFFLCAVSSDIKINV